MFSFIKYFLIRAKGNDLKVIRSSVSQNEFAQEIQRHMTRLMDIPLPVKA